MKRRGFLSLLLAAALTPPEPVRRIIEMRLPKVRPIKLVAYEEIGISICNVKALQRVQFAADLQIADKPRDILPA